MTVTGQRVRVVGPLTSGYESFAGRTGTVTRTFRVVRGGRGVEKCDIIVDDYPWGFQCDASNVQELDR